MPWPRNSPTCFAWQRAQSCSAGGSVATSTCAGGLPSSPHAVASDASSSPSAAAAHVTGGRSSEADALRERQRVRAVDGAGLPAHVGLPAVAARLAPAAGVLLAAEGAADLRAARADVHVGDAAIAAGVRLPAFRRAH